MDMKLASKMVDLLEIELARKETRSLDEQKVYIRLCRGTICWL